MSLDRPRRYNLRRVVSEARRLIEDEIAKRLAYYGLRADGTSLSPDRLPHLTTDDREVRARIEAAIRKEQSDRLDRAEATARYIRSVGFTYVNRFAALRAMEVRGFLRVETLVRRAEYGGRSLRERDIAEAQPGFSPDEVLRRALEGACTEAGEQIGVLFDLTDEYSLVFPAPRACRELIRLFAEEVPEADWREDDVVGWVYQYYNEEARARFKKARRKPTADDIPVINQFYTPHWVVRVLVDNTLGRMWLEMQGRCPVLKGGDPPVLKDLRIGVPDPRADPERFAAWLRDPVSVTAAEIVDTFCSYLVPLRNAPPPRRAKPIEEIKVLDPACGSGHFLVYAFDVLYLVWREARPELPPWRIPALILEHNLYGIDIDLRAVQLAALSLYLKARTVFEEALADGGISDRPEFRVARLNLVVADARIPTDGLRIKFLRRFAGDRDLQALFATLFEHLNHTNELGSLLKVRQPFEQLFERRYAQAQRRAAEAFEKGQPMLPEMKVQPDLGDAAAQVVTREGAIVEMTEQAMTALKEFEAEAMDGQDIGSRLFATEAGKSVGLLALLSQKYDVVLMNPPYGKVPPTAKAYLRKYYARTHRDVYAAFFEQAIELLQPSGCVGALTGRTFMFLKSYRSLREEIFHAQCPPQVIFDLGFEVLDEAVARWAAIVLRRVESVDKLMSEPATFFRQTFFSGDEKQLAFERALVGIGVADAGNRVVGPFYPSFADLAQVPGTPYAYWASSSLRYLFVRHPPLDRDVAKKPSEPKIADAKRGLDSGENVRFLRYFWETSPERIGREKKWVPFAKGGSIFYYDIDLVIDWENEGMELRDSANAVIRNERFHFRQGLTWARIVSAERMEVSVLPSGCLFDSNASTIFAVDPSYELPLLAFCTSSLCSFALNILDPLAHTRQVGYVAQLPTSLSLLESTQMGLFGQEAHPLLLEQNTGEETSTIFIKPSVLQVLHGFDPDQRPITSHPFAEQFEWAEWPSLQAIRAVQGSPEMSLRELAKLCICRKEMTDARVAELQAAIDEEVYRLYEISDEDRVLIERELALRQGKPASAEEDKGSPGFEDLVEAFDLEAVEDAGERVREHVRRLISFYVRQSVEAAPGGIVPLDTTFEDNLADAVRRRLAAGFGEEHVRDLEAEIAEILGKLLERWLAEDYFQYHVSLYKRRPIFWQLTSGRLGRSRRGEAPFSCLLHYHKLSRDTIPKVQAFHLRDVRDRAGWERDRLRRELEKAQAAGDRSRERGLRKQYEAAADRVDELDAFDATLTEIHNPRRDKYGLPQRPRWVDEKIAEVRDNGWTPVIDYGVRVNIEPLKEARVLPRAADRVR